MDPDPIIPTRKDSFGNEIILGATLDVDVDTISSSLPGAEAERAEERIICPIQ